MEIKANTKYKIGQQVYVVSKEREEYNCGICDGKGSAPFRGYGFICPICGGIGKMKSKKKYMPVATTISKIITETTCDGNTKVFYQTVGKGRFLDNRIAETWEGANAICEHMTSDFEEE